MYCTLTFPARNPPVSDKKKMENPPDLLSALYARLHGDMAQDEAGDLKCWGMRWGILGHTFSTVPKDPPDCPDSDLGEGGKY